MKRGDKAIIIGNSTPTHWIGLGVIVTVNKGKDREGDYLVIPPPETRCGAQYVNQKDLKPLSQTEKQ